MVMVLFLTSEMLVIFLKETGLSGKGYVANRTIFDLGMKHAFDYEVSKLRTKNKLSSLLG